MSASPDVKPTSMDETLHIHPIACRRCRQRKVRCNRALPQCNRCQKLGDECVYAKRAPNPSRSRTAKNTNTSDIAASRAILERLERLEQNCSSLSRSTASPSQPASATSCSPALHSVEVSPIPAFPSPGDNNEPDGTTASPSPVQQPTTPVLPTNNLEGLKIAVDDVQKRIVRSAMHHTIHGEKIDIPKELAKSWINVYLECNMGDPFPSLVDPKLLRLLPEIIDYPQLQVDSVTMLTYYCVLHQGASMGRGEAHMEENWLRKLYTCCIRALARWQHETKGSPEDFYAANLMRRIALENFDQDLAWILFTLACRYAQTLQLHQLDRQGGTGSAAIGKPIEDRDREGLWDLVQTDLLYRLVFDKPPTLTGDPEAWKVNLPKLTSQEDTMEDHTAAIQFLLRSRLTFVLSDYFHILDQWKEKKDSGLISRVEAICIQIKDLYDEWNIDKWVEELTSDALRLWTVSSIAFTGYHCIIYMLRRAVASVHNFSTLDEADDLVFKMPLAQIISKRMLEAARTLFKMDARLDILCVFLGGFNLHVPYIYLARRLLDTTETCPGLDNVDLLDHLAQAIEVIAEQNSEVEPLVKAMKRLNAEIQENMARAMAGSMAQN